MLHVIISMKTYVPISSALRYLIISTTYEVASEMMIFCGLQSYRQSWTPWLLIVASERKDCLKVRYGREFSRKPNE